MEPSVDDTAAGDDRPFGAGERWLLVEFAAVDRFHRGVYFPYLLGGLRTAGVAARWIRFGVQAQTRFVRGEDGIGLDEKEQATLFKLVQEHQPERVVFSQAPSSTLREALLAMVPHACFDDGNSQPCGWPRTGAPPDYGYEWGNEAARQMQPLPFVVLGEECTYDRALSLNPEFRHLDLSRAVRSGGCSFCSRPPSGGWHPSFSREGLRRNLVALVSTLPPFSGRLAVRLGGEAALNHVRELAEEIRASGMAPADWLLDSRADTLCQRRPDLAQACEVLRGTGHKFHMALIGIENFSTSELSRMNKGVSPQGNLDAMKTLLELERDFGDTFDFRKHGGLSVILFTPWSTLEDVAFNLRVAHWSRMGAVLGKLLTARLRLQEGLPLTVLARHDGLTTESYDDPALDTAARNLYEPEIPWRFRDSRLESVCRILVRLGGDTRLDDVPLATQVKEVANSAAQRGLSHLELAILLVQAAEEAGESVLDANLLLERVIQRWATVPPTFSTNAQEDWYKSEDIGGRNCRLLWEFSRSGIKPVSKLEPLRQSDVDDLVARYGAEHVQLRRRVKQGCESVFEAFLAFNPADAAKARELALEIETVGDESLFADAAQKIGKLLGYPPCCSYAWAVRDSYVGRSSYSTQQLARRLATPGAVDPIMTPWASHLAMHYVCCSLDCAQSLERSRRAWQIALKHQSASVLERLSSLQRNPWLVLLEGQARAMELVPLEEPGERFSFVAGVRTWETPELLRAAQADEVVISDERLLLLRQGQLWQDLSARAFVWWHKQAFQVPFWSRLLAIREMAVQREHAHYAPSAAEPPMEPAQSTWLERGMRKAIRELGVTPQGEDALSLTNLHVEDGRLALTLEANGVRTVLLVEDAKEAKRFLFRRGPFAFSHPENQPLDTPLKRRVVVQFAQALSKWLSSLAGAPGGSSKPSK